MYILAMKTKKYKINVIKKNYTKKKKKKRKKKRVFTKKHYNSGDGMLTSVWGPSLWHTLHTISFNYPVNPTNRDKKNYKRFIMSLKHVLPCKYCRINLVKNLKVIPLTENCLKDRNSFSRWMYKLHEHINKMLKKKSGLTYCDVRERYENFRSRCTLDEIKKKIMKIKKPKKTRKKEMGCTEPFYGKKSKCIIKIVPKHKKVKTFQMDAKCKKK
jgi:hypothetical protein